MVFYPKLQAYITDLVSDLGQIPKERKTLLEHLSAYIVEKKGKPIHLNFICTHNSRRSHLSQIWAATAAAYHGLGNIQCFSGGTEATAFNPRALAAIQRAGFYIENPGGDNPHYLVHYSDEAAPLTCFSKVFNDPFNPATDFAAVMTCTHADQNCPFIPGATRISIPYLDPKAADDTPHESATYDERVKQIGREMFYVMATVTKRQ